MIHNDLMYFLILHDPQYPANHAANHHANPAAYPSANHSANPAASPAVYSPANHVANHAATNAPKNAVKKAANRAATLAPGLAVQHLEGWQFSTCRYFAPSPKSWQFRWLAVQFLPCVGVCFGVTTAQKNTPTILQACLNATQLILAYLSLSYPSLS